MNEAGERRPSLTGLKGGTLVSDGKDISWSKERFCDVDSVAVKEDSVVMVIDSCHNKKVLL